MTHQRQINTGVFDCCCGVPHVLSAVTKRIVMEKGTHVTVTTPSGSWRVPRVFIAVHGIAAVDIPTLAQIHGWVRPQGNE